MNEKPDLTTVMSWLEGLTEDDWEVFYSYSEVQSTAKAALELLKDLQKVVLCKDCENWIPGYITDQDDFIPPKCGKYQQMVGHSADDFCSLAEKQEGR